MTMETNAPERIWLHPDYSLPSKIKPDPLSGWTCYTRESHEAAVCKAREVKVRALVWLGHEDDGYLSANTMVGEYEVFSMPDYEFGCSVDGPAHKPINISSRLPSIEAAKAAAQADFERRIMEALE